MRPSPVDPLKRWPDVVAALATALPAKAVPPRLKARLDARLRAFRRESAASLDLLSRPADHIREGVLRPSATCRRARGPEGRVVVSRCGAEAALFCRRLPPHERFSLSVRRADGSEEAVAVLESDDAGAGELPYVSVPAGPGLVAVELRREATGEVALAASL